MSSKSISHKWPWAALGSIAAILAIVAVGLMLRGRIGGGPDSTDHVLSVVRAWLNENLDDPKWDEVRSWPAIDFTKLQLADAQQLRSDTEKHWQVRLKKFPNEKADYQQAKAGFDETIESIKNAGPEWICRLKYRTKNKAGAMELRDEIFVMSGSKVTRIDAPMRTYSQNPFALFPE